MHDTRDLQYAAILDLLNADPERAYSDQETADYLGITREAVRLIEKRALEKLRKKMSRGDWRD